MQRTSDASVSLVGDEMPLKSSESAGEQASSGIFKFVMSAWGNFFKCICCPFLCCSCGPVVVIEQGWVGVMLRFGVFHRLMQPGMYALNAGTMQVRKVCMKMQTFEIPKQDAMTRDNLSLQVDAVTFVTVVDPGRAIFRVEDYVNAVRQLAKSTLLRVIAEHDLQQIFADRSKINERMTATMQERTADWGVKVASVELRDISIPQAMQRAMAQIAEANREADAKVIIAEGQRRAAFVFAEAAEAMERRPLSVQLQWFETLRQIAAENNSTVIVPDSILGQFGQMGRAASMMPPAAQEHSQADGPSLRPSATPTGRM